MSREVTFRVEGQSFSVHIHQFVAIGYAGRAQDEVKKHVDELAQLGVAAPPEVPMLYPLLPELATNAAQVRVIGHNSTPEVEVALIEAPGGPYVTVANDQTDRALEATSVTLAKNVCPKVFGQELWRVADVADHWDRLEIELVAQDVTLQRGQLAQLLPLKKLASFVSTYAPLKQGLVFLSGTVPTENPAPKGNANYTMTLTDPQLGRQIRHTYELETLEEFH